VRFRWWGGSFLTGRFQKEGALRWRTKAQVDAACSHNDRTHNDGAEVPAAARPANKTPSRSGQAAPGSPQGSSGSLGPGPLGPSRPHCTADRFGGGGGPLYPAHGRVLLRALERQRSACDRPPAGAPERHPARPAPSAPAARHDPALCPDPGYGQARGAAIRDPGPAEQRRVARAAPRAALVVRAPLGCGATSSVRVCRSRP
jgi:hypothetical protein